MIPVARVADWLERLEALELVRGGPDEGDLVGMRIDGFRCETMPDILREMRQAVLDAQRRCA